MDISAFRTYCLNKKGVTEEFPFGPDTLVFKVLGKMFALTGIDTFASINLKCDPEKALELREQYPAVRPGYHMSKKHWNTITMDGSIQDKLICQWVDDSYNLVVAGLKKSDRAKLEG